MSNQEVPPPPGDDRQLADLTEVITRRLLAGEVIDPDVDADADADSDLAQPPDGSESIRDLLPTILELVELGRIVARERRSLPPSDRPVS